MAHHEDSDRAGDSRGIPAGPPMQYYADDEISLFDLWDVLVRRWRWIVAVGLVVVLLGVGHVLTRADQYEYTHAIEIGEWPVIDPSGSAVQDMFDDGSRFLEPPETVAAKLEEKYLPAAIGAWRDANPDAGWRPRISGVSAADTGVVTMRAEGLASHEPAYVRIFEEAGRRLREDHEQILRSTRQALQVELSRARNRLAGLGQKLEHRQRELERLERHASIVGNEIEAVESLLEGTQRRHQSARRNLAEPTHAMTLIMLTNELFSARERLNELRVQQAVELPRQRDAVESEIAELEREMEIQEAEIALRESRIETVSSTQALSEPRRSGAPVGTSDGVIVALSVVLGGMLGVFAAFFVEFVQAANRRRREMAEE